MEKVSLDTYGTRDVLEIDGDKVHFYRLDKLERGGLADISRLPFSIRILLESLLRHENGFEVTADDIAHLAGWRPREPTRPELLFHPARVLLQDFTGVPSLVDLAAMRSAMQRLGGDPALIQPQVPVDLVIDHSVQVDVFGSPEALRINSQMEFQRNRERYEFLHWGQKAFENLRVVPPATGIVHQVNLEYLATVVALHQGAGHSVAYPDSLVGTDSHTPMIGGLGVVGWGVGGIEAEAAMLGQPIYMLTPDVVGFELYGELAEGATATDVVLTVTEMLRRKGVVGKFVEFFGEGLDSLSVPDRATISNMSPEYGATTGYFPIDNRTLEYLRLTGRSEKQVRLVERYAREQGLFRTRDAPVAEFTVTLELDLGSVEPSLAGPKRPQDRVAMGRMRESFRRHLTAPASQRGFGLRRGDLERTAPLQADGGSLELGHGTIVIAAITSCTNTSNPSVMLGAGLLARKAVERGLSVPPYVKTSLAPGSGVVTAYLERAGLLPYLEKLGFYVVGYGCTTCIGNSGPLPEAVERAVKEGELVAVAVLSGNRNFEGRIHPLVKASYLASPPLVVAYALAGKVDVDLVNEPLGIGVDGEPVYLQDIWPTQEEIRQAITTAVTPEQFRQRYADVFEGNEVWNSIQGVDNLVYPWDPSSTYIREPPFFVDLQPAPEPVRDIRGARVLVLLGDSVTTDHISPAGAIPEDSPAGRYLISQGVKPVEFNSYGSRRGNHEVMMRGTFANIRLRNLLVRGMEGGVTVHLPSGERMSIYDAAMRYKAEGTPRIILAGKEYGSGSSRDWAAKGTLLLGVKAVIAESYERIHRSNLVGMGVLPLQFKDGEGVGSLGLTGHESYDIVGLEDLEPGMEVTIHVVDEEGREKTFTAITRLDSPMEVDYYLNGGILHKVLREMLPEAGGDAGSSAQ
jgi:aconitate hydratase